MILRRSVLTAVPGATFALAPMSGSEADIKKAEEGWVAAVSKSDVSSADKLLSDNLVYTHSSGIAENKQEYLNKLKSGEQKYASIAYSAQKVQLLGSDAAVVTGTIRMTGATKGVPFDNTMFITHVWAKQGGAWKLVAHQTTKKA